MKYKLKYSYCIVMRTMFREGRENYLTQTMENLKRSCGDYIVFGSGDDSRKQCEMLQKVSMLIFDGGSRGSKSEAFKQEVRDAVDDTVAMVKGGRVGMSPNMNAAAALSGAVKMNIQSGHIYDYVLFLEDDIDFCDDFLGSVDRWIDEHFANRDDRHLVSFCAAYPQAKKDKPCWDYLISKFYGTQCYLLRMRDVESCADFMVANPLHNGKGQGHDMLLKKWAKERWPKVKHFLSTAPSFIQHIGKDSSLHLGRFHEYESWKGRDWSYKPVEDTDSEQILTSDDVVVPPGAQTIEQQKKRYLSERLVSLIVNYLPKDVPVIDLGCGSGRYVKALSAQGFRVLGVDGTPGIVDVAVCDKANIVELDLSKADVLLKAGMSDRIYSVMCLEVAEHIPKDLEDVFLENVTKVCEKHLILSWAVKGQGGEGHVNEQNWDYVVKKLRKLGFVYNREESLRWREEAGQDYSWFKNSIYIFERAN